MWNLMNASLKALLNEQYKLVAELREENKKLKEENEKLREELDTYKMARVIYNASNWFTEESTPQ